MLRNEGTTASNIASSYTTLVSWSTFCINPLSTKCSEKESLTLEVNGNGECGKILAVVNSNLEVKGYIENTNVKVEHNGIIKKDKIGNCGYIKVIKDMKLKEPYVGITTIQTGDISRDITYYYNCSEQIMSYLTIEEYLDDEKNVKRMCGIFVQVMPDVKDETIKYLKDNIYKFELFKEFISNGNTLEDIIIYIFKRENLKFNDKRRCVYKCDCSRHKMTKGLISLGKKELLDMINQDNQANLECHFCGKNYMFKNEDLENIIRDM